MTEQKEKEEICQRQGRTGAQNVSASSDVSCISVFATSGSPRTLSGKRNAGVVLKVVSLALNCSELVKGGRGLIEGALQL